MFQIYHSQVSCVVLQKEYHSLISLNSNSFIKDGTIQNMFKKKNIHKGSTEYHTQNHRYADYKKKFTGRKYQKLRGKTIIINSLSWSIIGVSLYPPITD